MTKRKLNPEQGKRLNECLEDIKMKQKELAEKSGYTPQYISYLVNGKKNLSAESAKIFSKILGVNDDYLLCLNDFKTFQDWLDSLSEENDILRKSVLSMLKVYGISISEPTYIELTDQELECINRFTAVKTVYHSEAVVTVQIDNETPQEISANEVFEFIERIIEFTEFQAKKLKDKLDENKPLLKLLSKEEK